jgi:hypothetical protein
MKQDRLRNLARQLSFRARFLLNIVGLLVGAALIVIPHFLLSEKSTWPPVLTHLGSAILGAAFVALVTQFALTGELEHVDRGDLLAEDAQRLGLTRLMADLRDVQDQVPLKESLRDASVVYILGTTISNTARMHGLISASPRTEFRFLYVNLPNGEAGQTLERTISIIHDQAVGKKIQAADEDLSGSKVANLKYKQLCCAPTFSAILAEWQDGRCWLQVDHYLMRTKCDHRVWLTFDNNKGRAELLTRYKAIIDDMWQRPERYDITAPPFPSSVG